MLDALANHVQLALEPGASLGIGHVTRGADEELLKDRLRGAGAVADQAIVGRHIAPPEEALPFLVDDPGNHLLHDVAVTPVVRQEYEADAVRSGRRQLEGCDFPEKRVRCLDQNPGAVAGVRLAAAGSAVLQIDEHVEGISNDLMRPLSFDVHDETHAARIVFRAGVVQTLSGRRTAVVRAEHNRNIVQGRTP